MARAMKSGGRGPARRAVRTDREGAILVAAIGGIVAALGQAAVGVGIVVVAAVIFGLGLLTPSPPAKPRIVEPKRPRPRTGRRPRTR